MVCVAPARALVLALALALVMFDCLPPAWLHVGQYELELVAPPLAALPLPPAQVGQYVELVELALPPRAAFVPVAFPVTLPFPRVAPALLLDVLNVPRWACWADGRVAPWLDRKLNDDNEEIAFICYLFFSLKLFCVNVASGFHSRLLLVWGVKKNKANVKRKVLQKKHHNLPYCADYTDFAVWNVGNEGLA